MNKAYFLWLISLAITCIFSQTPPFWGGNPRYSVKVHFTYNHPIAQWNFTYLYDSTLKAQRWQHQASQHDRICNWANTPFNKTELPCHVTFATDGWSYIQFPDKKFCCKCEKSFGAVKYDWLQQNSTFVGKDTINGYAVNHWTKQGIYLNHYYATIDKELPVRFYQIKDGNPKIWDFDLNTYSTAPIDPSKFGPQCSNRCLGTCDIFMKKQHLSTE